ncbi:MAG: thiosulfate oxidation carrier complex protein SoxZ [Betaproteobacteria bacterium]|nr:thiosulfate oxidation carrier complex protein SoxZ [Betaproteobacteria bacterium]
MPTEAKKGELVRIRAIAAHQMETGFRNNERGASIPRDIITAFRCTYNGVEVFRADLFPATAANPLIEFTTLATESGTLRFEWSGDNGFSAADSASITVV